MDFKISLLEVFENESQKYCDSFWSFFTKDVSAEVGATNQLETNAIQLMAQWLIGNRLECILWEGIVLIWLEGVFHWFELETDMKTDMKKPMAAVG